MLPNNAIFSADKWLADLKPPKDRKHSASRAFTVGGSAIGNTENGISAYTWEAWTDGSSVYIKRSDLANTQRVLTDKSITEIDVAFDRQMNLVVAYQSGVETKLWVASSAGRLLGSVRAVIRGGASPRVALDDTRAGAIGSDVIFAYVYESKLCCRYQRDNYAIEHRLQVFESDTSLYRIGMGYDNRFLFLLQQEVLD